MHPTSFLRFSLSVRAFALVLIVGHSPVQGQSLAPEIKAAVSSAELAEIRREPTPIGAFVLRDQRGEPFSRDSLSGDWSLLMFGFTHCPDVCPVHLAMLKQMREELREAGYSEKTLPGVVLVSVDPQRDTPEQLGRYVAHFDPRFIGASGDPEQLELLEESLDAGHRIFSEDVSGNYDVMHTSSVYVIDPEVRLVGKISPPFSPQKLAAAFDALRLGERPHGH